MYKTSLFLDKGTFFCLAISLLKSTKVYILSAASSQLKPIIPYKEAHGLDHTTHLEEFISLYKVIQNLF